MITIQKASTKDIPALCNLLDILFSQEIEFIPDQALQSKGLETIISSEYLGDIFVAIKDDTIVGMLNILYSYSTALGAKVALLEDMVISPSCRDDKIGSTLIQSVMEYLQKEGIKRVTLLTDEENLKAHRFYEKNGFTVSTMRAFRKGL